MLGSPGLSPNTGPLATASWLVARNLFPTSPWFAEIVLTTTTSSLYVPLDDRPTTHFAIEIYEREWGFVFRHDHKASWIRVTDLPFVHGRDDHGLLDATPALKNIGHLVRALERRHRVDLDREAPWLRTTIANGEPAIREWIATL